MMDSSCAEDDRFELVEDRFGERKSAMRALDDRSRRLGVELRFNRR